MDTLFPTKQEFHVVRLTEQDVVLRTDYLRLFGEQLEANEPMYPCITRWFREKVLPGLRDGSRAAYLGFEGEIPILTAVVKRGDNAKFCHLRIAREFQDLHLGEIFFCLMALEVRKSAQRIHFTLPESLWVQRREFFSGFNFREASRARTQYRLFEEELETEAQFWDVWRAARQRLPGLMHRFSVNDYSMSLRLLLAIKPEFGDRLLSGKKTIEIRRRFHGRWQGSRAALYSSSPDRALIGEATIGEVKSAPPDEIWEEYGDRIGCTREDFDSYTSSCGQVYAINICEVIPYASRIPVCQFEYLLEEELTPPQSHCEVHTNHSWGKAISIAALLHGFHRTAAVGRRVTVL